VVFKEYDVSSQTIDRTWALHRQKRDAGAYRPSAVSAWTTIKRWCKILGMQKRLAPGSSPDEAADHPCEGAVAKTSVAISNSKKKFSHIT